MARQNETVEIRFRAQEWADWIIDDLREEGYLVEDEGHSVQRATAIITDAIESLFEDGDTFEVRVNGRRLQ